MRHCFAGRVGVRRGDDGVHALGLQAPPEHVALTHALNIAGRCLTAALPRSDGGVERKPGALGRARGPAARAVASAVACGSPFLQSRRQ